MYQGCFENESLDFVGCEGLELGLDFTVISKVVWIKNLG